MRILNVGFSNLYQSRGAFGHAVSDVRHCVTRRLKGVRSRGTFVKQRLLYSRFASSGTRRHPCMQIVECGRHHLRSWHGVRAISFFEGFKYRRRVGGRIAKCSLFGDVMRLDSGLSGGGGALTQIVRVDADV